MGVSFNDNPFQVERKETMECKSDGCEAKIATFYNVYPEFSLSPETVGKASAAKLKSFKVKKLMALKSALAAEAQIEVQRKCFMSLPGGHSHKQTATCTMSTPVLPRQQIIVKVRLSS